MSSAAPCRLAGAASRQSRRRLRGTCEARRTGAYPDHCRRSAVAFAECWSARFINVLSPQPPSGRSDPRSRGLGHPLRGRRPAHPLGHRAGVEVSGDLRQATVYVSVMGSEAGAEARPPAGSSTPPASSSPRSPKRLQTRFTPVLTFKLDDSVKKSVEIGRLIDEAIASDRKRPSTRPARALPRQGQLTRTSPGEDAHDDAAPRSRFLKTVEFGSSHSPPGPVVAPAFP